MTGVRDSVAAKKVKNLISPLTKSDFIDSV